MPLETRKDRIRHGLGILLIAMCLTACSDGDALLHGSTLAVGRADTLHIADSLGAAGNSFLGTAGQHRAGGPKLRAGPSIDISLRDTDYTTDRNIAISLSKQHDWALRPRTSFSTSVSIGVEDGRYTLPDGIGVLADPATAQVQSIGATVQAGIRQQIFTSDTLAASVAVNRGIDLAHNRISIQSALLDVRAQSNDVTQFTAVELAVTSPRLTLARHQPAFALTARKYDGHGYSVLGRLVIPLTRTPPDRSLARP